MRRLAALLSVVALVAGACAAETSTPPTTVGATGSAPTTTTRATSVETPTTIITTSTTTLTPQDVVEPTQGLWPPSLSEILLANEEGVVLLGADGMTSWLTREPATATHLDGAGGLVILRPPSPYKGVDMEKVAWIPAEGAGQLMAVRMPGRVELLDVVWMPTEPRGPQFAAVLTPEASGTCVRLEPFVHIPRQVGVGGNRVCRHAGEGGISWVSWSGRFFVLTLASRHDGTWLAFADGEGNPLEMAHDPALLVPDTTTIRLATAVSGTNQLLFVERDRAGYETLVVVDLDGGATYLRRTLAGPGEFIARIEAIPGAAVVSRSATGADAGTALPPLLVDLSNGAVGTIGRSGTATIPVTDQPVPALFPSGTTRDGVELRPDIVATAPADHARVGEQFVRFEGWATPGSRVASGPYEADVDAAGRWELVLGLDPGSNVATFTAAGAGPQEEATYRVPVYREVDGARERWLNFLFWTPSGYDPPFGHEIFDAWTLPAIPTGLRAYTLEGPLMAVAAPGVPITHSPEMLWIVDRVAVGPGGHGLVYLTHDVLVVDPANNYFVRVDDGEIVVGFAGRSYRVDAESGRFVEQ